MLNIDAKTLTHTDKHTDLKCRHTDYIGIVCGAEGNPSELVISETKRATTVLSLRLPQILSNIWTLGEYTQRSLNLVKIYYQKSWNCHLFLKTKENCQYYSLCYGAGFQYSTPTKESFSSARWPFRE